MIGRVLKHYRILEKLGEGGMGVVYRAWDERLKRPVALKVLHASSGDDAPARRLIRNEAAALLRLSHPRIGTLLDFDRSEDTDFIVMEFVTGTTLEQRLSTGAIPAGEALPLAVQIAEAIEEAHEHGVIHRDLKPGNVMVSPKGQVKVLDFGLARLVRTNDESRPSILSTQSDAGSPGLAGTLAYMAPEQVLTGTVGISSDIYSFGVVLFEMLTGDRPFKGTTTISLADAILHQVPQPPSRLVAGMAAPLEKLILRCLEKDPARRYASAGDVLGELRALTHAGGAPTRGPGPRRRWTIAVAVAALVALGALALAFDLGGIRRLLPGAAPPPRSIAVLPLANLSGDPQQEFFVDGMTDAITTQMARIGTMRVISRTSVMRYKGSRATLRQISRELGVDAVVEGSVMRSGDEVRINAELVECATDRQLWAEEYERKIEDVLTLQREVAIAIAAEVHGKLSPEQRARLSGGVGPLAAPDPRAAEAYLKGRYYASKPSEAMLRISLRFFEEATRIDSSYATAWAGLANSHVLLGASGGQPSMEEFAKAKQCARRALSLDDGLADAHVPLGLAYFYGDWDWPAAKREFERALEINPGDAQAHNWYSGLLSAAGRHEQAIAEARKAAELDPLSIAIQLNVGVRLYYARRTGEAVESLRRTQDLDPEFSATHYWLGLALQQRGQFQDAIAEYRLVVGPEAIGPLGCAYASSGNRAEAGRMLSELAPATRSGQGYVSPLDLATICVGLGQKDQAFEWLNQAVQQRATHLTTIRVDPLLDPLRGDPRFAALLRRVGVPT
jgi:serine/threonine-protein kinase